MSISVQIADVQLVNFTLLLAIRKTLIHEPGSTSRLFDLSPNDVPHFRNLGVGAIEALVANVGQCLFTFRRERTEAGIASGTMPESTCNRILDLPLINFITMLAAQRCVERDPASASYLFDLPGGEVAYLREVTADQIHTLAATCDRSLFTFRRVLTAVLHDPPALAGILAAVRHHAPIRVTPGRQAGLPIRSPILPPGRPRAPDLAARRWQPSVTT